METVDEVTTQRILCVIASSSPASIQFSNATAAGLIGGQQGCQSCDLLCSLSEPLKQVKTIVEILPTGGRRTGDEDIRADIQGGRFVGQRYLQFRLVDCNRLMDAIFARNRVEVDRQPPLLHVLLPLRIATDAESESIVVPDPVFLFQVLTDEEFESGSLPPFQRIAIVPDEGTKVSTLLAISPVSGEISGLTFPFEREERPPRFVIHPSDRLDGPRTEDADVAVTGCIDLPNVAIGVGVALATLVGDFVPERSGSVQQPSKEFLILFRPRDDIERVGPPHGHSLSAACDMNPCKRVLSEFTGILPGRRGQSGHRTSF